MTAQAQSVEVDVHELTMLLEGIENESPVDSSRCSGSVGDEPHVWGAHGAAYRLRLPGWNGYAGVMAPLWMGCCAGGSMAR